MRIIVLGNNYTEGFAVHISQNLLAMGHKVIQFDPEFKGYFYNNIFNNYAGRFIKNAAVKVPFFRKFMFNRLQYLISNFQPELIIVCYDFLWPKEVSIIKKICSVKIVLWYPDSIANFGSAYFMTAPYDFLFFKDQYIVQKLRNFLKHSIHYLPECFNPIAYYSNSNKTKDREIEYSCDITTAGNFHSWRVSIFNELLDFDIKLWGNPPPVWMDSSLLLERHQNKCVYNEDKVAAFQGAKIVVNTLHYSEIMGVNARCFEIAGSKAFQFCNYSPVIKDFFVEGKEIILYHNLVDLKEKIKYWLPRQNERSDISNAAYDRAIREHTYENRLGILISTVFSSGNGFPMNSDGMLY